MRFIISIASIMFSICLYPQALKPGPKLGDCVVDDYDGRFQLMQEVASRNSSILNKSSDCNVVYLLAMPSNVKQQLACFVIGDNGNGEILILADSTNFSIEELGMSYEGIKKSVSKNDLLFRYFKVGNDNRKISELFDAIKSISIPIYSEMRAISGVKDKAFAPIMIVSRRGGVSSVALINAYSPIGLVDGVTTIRNNILRLMNSNSEQSHMK